MHKCDRYVITCVYSSFDRVRVNTTVELSSPAYKRQYLTIDGQISKCSDQSFEQEGSPILNIVSQTVRFLTVYGSMLLWNPGEGRFKVALNRTRSNSGHFEKPYSKLTNVPPRNFVHQTTQYLAVYGKMLLFSL